MFKLFILCCLIISNLLSMDLIDLDHKGVQNVYLNNNQKLEINLLDKENNISFVEYDRNQLYETKYENGIKTFESSYHMIPNVSELVIYISDDYNKSIIKLKLNVIYDLNKNLSNITDTWFFDKNITFKNESFILESTLNNTLEYYLNFDDSFSFSFDMIKNSKNDDFKIVFGDRISITFDNKNVYFVLKNKINNKIEYEKIKLSNDNIKLDNNKSHNISLEMKQIKILNIPDLYEYTLNIINLDDNINYSYQFKDDGKNKIEYERYKVLKLIYNNMNVELKNIIIKGNQ